MPFKDPEKERAWRKAYWAARPQQRKAIVDRYRVKHREKILAYAKEYSHRPAVIERRKEYYLENREERLKNNKLNYLLKKYEHAKQSVFKRRKYSREYARRKRCGIEIERNENGYFWKAGKIGNGPFVYRKEAIKDAECAFLL